MHSTCSTRSMQDPNMHCARITQSIPGRKLRALQLLAGRRHRGWLNLNL